MSSAKVLQLDSTDSDVTQATENPLLNRTIQRVPDKAPKRVPTTEPQMRSLRRILGDSVLDIIPFDVREAVDAVHAFGKANPEAFQYTPFESAEEKESALTIMRAYAEMAGEKGYTVYSQADEDPALLVWKVTDRRTRKTAGSAGAGE